MDDGIIASRYAKALLKYVLETGNGARVSAQAKRLEQVLGESQELRLALDSPTDVTAAQKRSLLRAALGDEPMAAELERFLGLVLVKGRIPLLRLMLHDFIALHHRSCNVLYARLTTAVAAPDALVERLRAFVRGKTGKEVDIETLTDPSLIGGFIFDVEDYRMDASVLRSLQDIRREFQETNRRIV